MLVKNKESLRDEQRELINKQNAIKHNIESINNEQEKLYQPVHNSFDISLRKEQNIIKLHGTIRHADNKTYGFDNDPRCHYVITNEDYEKYPEKHEAFVSLMRIALLQDSFCLIGFSGDDPNFTSWLSWVRDILDRRGREDKEKKIFFIDVSGYPLSESKKLFFNNHYIKHVPLFDDPLKATPERIKSGLIALFKSLSRETIAIKAVQQYRNFWQNYELNPPRGDKSYLYGHKRTQIREIWDNRSFNRLARLESDYTGKKMKLINGLEGIISKGQIDEDTAKLLVIAFKGDFIPLDVGIDLDKFDALRDLLKPYPVISREFELLYLRSLNLAGRNISDYTRKNTSDAYVYESIINTAFRLDFTLMKEQLDSWNPVKLRWKSGKIALGSYFNLEIDTTYSEIEKATETNIQEYRYFLDTILQITFGTEWIGDKDEFYSIHDKKRETVSQELNKLSDNTDYLIKKLSEEKVDFSPRDRTFRTRHMGGDMPLKYSIQYLQVIIEIGLPLQKRHVTLTTKQEWYRAFKKIYTRYPYPCLFYSLQYGDEESFIKRIAEDYVYSNQLSPIHDEILSCCLKAYLMPETPVNIKQGVLSFAPLFFKKVKASSWRQDFEKIVRTFDLSNRDPNRKRLDPPYGFLYAGLLYTSSQVYKVQFINKILSLGDQIDHVDNHLLIAAKKNLSEKFKQRVKASLLIDQLIDAANQVSQYYVIFNLHDLLSPLQKEKIVKKLIQFDFKNCNEGGMFEASSSFSKQNPLLSSKIESGITTNNLLWHNGISYDNGRKIIGYGSNFIRISKIQEYVNFSKSTILILYDKLKESVYDMKLVIDGERDLFIFQSYWARLLIEMHLFLRKNQSTLKAEKEFDKISKLVEKTYLQLSNTESIMSSLISDKDDKVREGVQKLVFEVDCFGIQKFIPEYLVIANRIAAKANPGLNSCINNFSSAMKYEHEKIDIELFKPFLTKILEQYEEYFSNPKATWEISAKKEDVEAAMLQFNEVAKKWYGGNEYWNTHKRLFKQD